MARAISVLYLTNKKSGMLKNRCPDQILLLIWVRRSSKILKANRLDDALIGIGRRCSQEDVLVYDFNKAVKILVDRDKMTEEEAVEYLEFNTVGAWVGEETPVFVYPMTMEEIDEMQ